MILQLISCVESSMSSHWYVGHLIRFYVIHTSLETDFWIPISTYLLKQHDLCKEGRAAYLMKIFVKTQTTNGEKSQSLIGVFDLLLSFFFFFLRSRTWSSIQHTQQVWCRNFKPPVHLQWEWTVQWSKRHLLSSRSNEGEKKFNGVNILYFVRHTCERDLSIK